MHQSHWFLCWVLDRMFHAMKPTYFQRLFVDNRPLYLLMATGAAVSVAWFAMQLWPLFEKSPWNLLWCVMLLPVAAALGAMLGALSGCFILPPILDFIERRNGKPFHVGDEVVILSKRHRGRVVRIYEVWPERHLVRVELDEPSRKSVTDAFGFTDICRQRLT